MEEQEIKKENKNGRFTEIIITQIICVTVILTGLLVTKYFFKDTYTEIKEWYKENICAQTDINEVLVEDGEIDEI